MLRFLLSALYCLGLLAPAAAQSGLKNDSIAADKRPYNLFKPTPRRYMRPMVPDRPGITESPYSVDAGHVQYEADALRLLTRRAGTVRGRDWYVNHALVKLGLSDRIDLQVGLDSYTATRTYDMADTSAAEISRGLGDLSLRLKRTLVGDDNSRWALGLIAYATLPTGGERGAGAAEYGAVLPVVVQLTKPWSIGGQVAAQLRWDPDGQARFLQLTPTLATDYRLTRLLQLFVEIVGYDEVSINDWRSSVNTGAHLDFSDNVQLDLGTHLPLTPATDREYFLGLSFRR